MPGRGRERVLLGLTGADIQASLSLELHDKSK